MTILIGILFSDGVVVASDSQASYGFSSKKECEKISIVNFGKDQMIVAQSGVGVWGKRIVELMQDRATGKRMKSPRFAVDTNLAITGKSCPNGNTSSFIKAL